MGLIKLLDCSLRDGGYINDWNFGHDNMVSIFERLVESNVDMIEVGFLDNRRQFDINRSIIPNTDCVEKIFGGLDRKHALVFGMIDYGTCDISTIKHRKDSWLDGIRVIFKEQLRDSALKYIKQLKDLGYLVSAQLVSVTTYTEETLMDLIRLANEVKPYAVSMVDTYGLMHQNNLIHYFDILNNNLDPEIALGYHGHNNFQMGYANCIEMLSQSKTTDRTILVDGTLYGMGKSAGNAPIELISMHLNVKYGKYYDISQMLEAIESNIMQFYKPATWGYNMFFYLAALNDCHPNYVRDLMSTRSLSIKQVNELLGRLQGEKKILYDKSYLEGIYRDFLTNDINDKDDIAELINEISGRKLLIVGPGTSMETEKDKVQSYVKENNPIVISVNYLPESIKTDYLFLSNAKRYVQLATRLYQSDCKIISTSNVTSTGKIFNFRLNITELLDKNAIFIDNSLMMIIKTLTRMNIKNVMLAGFDGYSQNGSNYFDPNKEYEYAKQQSEYLNLYISMFLCNLKEKINVKFITSTRYLSCRQYD